MLAVLLKILSVLGIILLVLLGILLFTLLLVLFFPITYRIYGRKNAEDMIARVKVNWLFGLLRIRFAYPTPGRVFVKLLCFTLYDSSASKEPKQNQKQKGSAVPSKTEHLKNDVSTSVWQNTDQTKDAAPKQTCDIQYNSASDTEENTTSAPEENAETENLSGFLKIKQLIFEKFKKIKYTIIKIYDKIKDILENLAFYKELLQDKDTVALLGHAKLRAGRILKKLRPKRLKADITFGTGSPDTTGYALAAYGILSPQIRKPCYVNLTPDFTQSVFQGEITAAGHITVFCLLSNGILLLLDKRLRMLIHKIKQHNAAQNVT